MIDKRTLQELRTGCDRSIAPNTNSVNHTARSLVNQTQFRLTSDYSLDGQFRRPMNNRKLGGTGSGYITRLYCTAPRAGLVLTSYVYTRTLHA